MLWRSSFACCCCCYCYIYCCVKRAPTYRSILLICRTITNRKVFFPRFSYVCHIMLRRFRYFAWKMRMLFVQKPKRENNIVALVNVQGMYKDNPNAGRMQSELFGFSSDLYDSIPIAGFWIGPDFYVHIPCTSLTCSHCTQVNTTRQRRNVYTSKPSIKPKSTISFS